MKNRLMGLLFLTLSQAVLAEDTITLQDKVAPDVKAAIEAASSAVQAAKKANAEWIWEFPVDGLWEGTLLTTSKILQQAITKANAGDAEQAKALADFLQKTATAGVKQAQTAPQAAPSL